MKDIINFADEMIKKINGPLDELLIKHGCTSVMKLLQKTDIPEEDIRTAIKLVHSRDSYITMANYLNRQYSEGVFKGDSDAELKRRCLYSVTGHVLDRVTKPNTPQFSNMDGIPTSSIVDGAIQCIIAGELELAVLGLSYAIYQKQFQKTNRADKKLEEVFGGKPAEPTEPLETA
jgi:hypothetical protein